MINALTYQEMLRKINDNAREEGLIDDYIGILITRPDLETGQSILNSLEYYHHLTGKNVNFYLPGYGAYWYGAYPDEKVVAEIADIQWSFSNKAFVEFIQDMEEYSNWEYSGESELLLVRTENGILTYEVMMQFHIDNMLRDGVIWSISAFFQQLSRLFKDKDSLEDISNSLGKDKLIQTIVYKMLEKLPNSLGNIITQEKYFCVKNMKK